MKQNNRAYQSPRILSVTLMPGSPMLVQYSGEIGTVKDPDIYVGGEEGLSNKSDEGKDSHWGTTVWDD